MFTRPLRKNDYDLIVQVIDRWSGGPSAALAHPVFFHDLGEMSRVVERDGELVGFLFGFIPPPAAVSGYVHLIGVHPNYRRRGLGRALCQSFEADCRSLGCIRLKSMTTPGNDAVVQFHQSLGWSVALVDDYAGPGRPRVVFEKTL